MPGTWKHAAITLVIACGLPGIARAYHNGNVFDDPAGAGGGDGLFYTGSKRERQWDCTLCHVDPPKRLEVKVTSQPGELIDQLRYTPGTTYTLTVAFVNPTAQLGLTATRSNFNAMVITTEDSQGIGAGTFGGFDSGKFYARGTSVLASDSPTVNETSWTFNWTAPAGGPVTLNLGIVDGNGAGSSPSETLTDPQGDDVVVLAYTVTDGAARSAVMWATHGATNLAHWLSSLVR